MSKSTRKQDNQPRSVGSNLANQFGQVVAEVNDAKPHYHHGKGTRARRCRSRQVLLCCQEGRALQTKLRGYAHTKAVILVGVRTRATKRKGSMHTKMEQPHLLEEMALLQRWTLGAVCVGSSW
jgi:hypothetical protein